MLKKVARLHTKILTLTINIFTSLMLSFIITYTKHKIDSQHDDLVATWSVCLVQLHTLKPIHNILGKLIMWFLLKHKMFVDEQLNMTEIDSEPCTPEEEDISMTQFRKDLWNIFIT